VNVVARRARPVLVAAAVVLALVSGAGAAVAQTVIDTAAESLRRDPVYVDPAAERASQVDAGRLRQRIRSGDTPIFVAVLPAAAVAEAGGDPGQLAARLGQRVGVAGTYAVLAGNSFRAASNVLPARTAASLATSSFQQASSEGPQAVLERFIERVQAAAGPAGSSGGAPSGERSGADGGGGGGGGTWLWVLLLGGGVVLAVLLTGRSRKRKEAARKQAAADREELGAELSVLAGDVVTLEDQVDLHPDARPDYDAAVTRYQAAQAAIERAGDDVDFARVRRVIDEGRYAMNRARAVIEGRDPPAPPAELTRPGSRNEPPVQVDEQGQPFYAGAGVPFYGGGGWFGGGGLLTGFLLGSMLGGGFGGWGGGWGRGGYYGGDGGGDADGGDGGGDFGGGDFGGGDFGGGDFGGGDFGGGDFG
jgi:hypothetical protein